jgi:hypothetical protein
MFLHGSLLAGGAARFMNDAMALGLRAYIRGTELNVKTAAETSIRAIFEQANVLPKA